MKARILIIEDNPTNMDLMFYLLTAFGYPAECVTNGEEGVKLARQFLPDLIVCDVQLPGISGFDVVRQLKSDGRTRRIPIVAVTAFAMVGDRDRLLSGGFDGYISKPIAPETFVNQLEKFLKVVKSSQTSVQKQTGKTPSRGKKDLGITILAVDNSLINLEIAKSTLEPFGYRVVSASGVEEALNYMRQNLPDLILSDLHMPELTGYHLLRAVMKDVLYRQIPFVVLTSSVFGDKDLECLNLGAAQRFVQRPIEPQALVSEIESCLDGRKKS